MNDEMTEKEIEECARYQLLACCEEADPVAVSEMTERQAKLALCKLIDKLESLESGLRDYKKRHETWRNVRTPK